MQHKEINFGNTYGAKAYCDMTIIDNGQLVFASVIGADNTLKSFQRAVGQGQGCHIGNNMYNMPEGFYTTEKHKDQKSGLSHLLVYRKAIDMPVKNDSVQEKAYFFVNHTKEDFLLDGYVYTKGYDKEIPSALEENIYELIKNYTTVPVIKDWAPYLAQRALRQYLVSALRVDKSGDAVEKHKDLHVYKFNFQAEWASQVISQGLQDGDININGRNDVSTEASEIRGLDSYLQNYSSQLADKIKKNFKAKFDSSVDQYDDKLNHFERISQSKKLNLYPAQKAVIQSVSNNMKQNDVSIIVGEPASGKTIMSMGSIYTHTHKTKTNNIVMCPGILVNNWKKELTEYMPNSLPIVIEGTNAKSAFDQFKEAEKIMKDPLVDKHVFLILSAETAKLSYNKKPAVQYSERKQAYLCPECGQPIFRMVKSPYRHARRNDKVKENLSHMDFVSDKSTDNQTCPNEVNNYKGLGSHGKPKKKKCAAPLWTALLRTEDMEWLKLGSNGWVNKNAIGDLEQQLIQNHPEKKHKEMLKAISLYNFDPKNIASVQAPVKYSISHYVLRYMKGQIDYFIADEIHQYKGELSQNGAAFGHLVAASKKTIGLTGTLLNGYANSIFHILYRCYSRKMVGEKFKFGSGDVFASEYGVVKTTTRVNIRTRESKKGAIKIQPGVSPLVFTRFLLGNAAFISLDEMRNGMVPYREIPTPISMDPTMTTAYANLEREARSAISGRGRQKVLSRVINVLNWYPDMPYGHAPVVNPDTNQTVFTPSNMDHYKSVRTPKMLHVLNLVQEKIANGEKVMVYYTHPGETDIGKRLTEMFEEEGIKSAELKSGSGKTSKREEWINNKINKNELDVLITNPSLVEVGLNLLDFTTIVFYQIPYNTYTLRQASRRSWRLTQTKPVEVHFLYYRDTTQQQALSLIANKLEASMAIEGRFSEEGLQAMSNNDDLLMRIATSVANGIKEEVRAESFEKFSFQGNDGSADDKNTLKYILPYTQEGTQRSHSRKYLSSTQRTLMTMTKRNQSVANLIIGA